MYTQQHDKVFLLSIIDTTGAIVEQQSLANLSQLYRVLNNKCAVVKHSEVSTFSVTHFDCYAQKGVILASACKLSFKGVEAFKIELQAHAAQQRYDALCGHEKHLADCLARDSMNLMISSALRSVRDNMQQLRNKIHNEIMPARLRAQRATH